MLRDRILGHLIDIYHQQGASEWVAVSSVASELEEPIADIMYESGALCEMKLAERTGERARDMIRVTPMGLAYFNDSN